MQYQNKPIRTALFSLILSRNFYKWFLRLENLWKLDWRPTNYFSRQNSYSKPFGYIWACFISPWKVGKKIFHGKESTNRLQSFDHIWTCFQPVKKRAKRGVKNIFNGKDNTNQYHSINYQQASKVDFWAAYKLLLAYLNNFDHIWAFSPLPKGTKRKKQNRMY